VGAVVPFGIVMIAQKFDLGKYHTITCRNAVKTSHNILGSDDSLQHGFAQPLANDGWRIEGEGREVKREEKMGLGVWDRTYYHRRSGRDLGSASQDGEVGGIVLIMGTSGDTGVAKAAERLVSRSIMPWA